MFTDSIEELDGLFETSSSKCPNCAANIFFNERLGKLVCGSCGGVFEPEGLKPSGRIEKRDIEDAGDEEEDKQEFVCDSCGASVVTDYNTAATFCAFCGSPTLIKRRLSKSFRPDLIIPFKVSKEDAIKNFREWASKLKGVPKEFLSDATLTKITGYYVPFWLIDADCTAVVGGSGKILENEVTANFFIGRDITFRVTKVPFDGCAKIPNLLMEAIEPFDYKDLRPYNDMYLPGFYAQRYDQSALDMLDLIKIRIDNYAAGLVKQFSTTDYDEVSVSATGSKAGNFSQLYALMPVWFLNVKYDGAIYSIAVNGQTGEASGNLPIKKSNVRRQMFFKMIPCTLKHLAVTLIPSLFLSLPFLGMFSNDAKYSRHPEEVPVFEKWVPWFFIVWLVIIILGMILYIPYTKRKLSSIHFSESVTLDREPDLSQYIDLKAKFHMEKKDKMGMVTHRTDSNFIDSVMEWVFK